MPVKDFAAFNKKAFYNANVAEDKYKPLDDP